MRKPSLIFAFFAAFALSRSALAAEEVKVGAYIHDIQHLDLKTHSYSVDMYIGLRWRDGGLNPAASLEFMNPYELWGHVRTMEHEKPIRLPNGEWYQVIRNRGRFSKKLLLNKYPFDKHALVVEFEDSRLSTAGLKYVPDGEPIAVNPALKLPGFKVGQAALYVVDAKYPTRFGDTRRSAPEAFSQVRIELPIERPVLTYLIKLVLPVLCVVFSAALMFLFNPNYVDARVGIGITALLTIVALQITLNEDLPEIDYLVLMDKIYLSSYLFVIAGLALIVKSTWLVERGELQAAVRLDRRGLAVLSAMYAVVVGFLVLGNI